MILNKKHLIVGLCIVICIFLTFVSTASAVTCFAEDNSDHNNFLRDSHSLIELNKPSVRESAIEGPQYNFNLNGNAGLLWKHEDPRVDSYIVVGLTQDIDGDNMTDAIICVNWNGSAQLVLMSITGIPIWFKVYDQEIEIAGETGDSNGDGTYEFLIYSFDYNITTDKQTLNLSLLNENTGSTMWSNVSIIEGEWEILITTIGNDLNGDGANDVFSEWYNRNEDKSRLCAISGIDGSVIWEVTVDGYSAGSNPPVLPDLNSDGTADLVTSINSYYDETANVTVLSGIDGSTLWSQPISQCFLLSFLSIDYNNDGIEDVIVEGFNLNSTGSIYLLDGTNGNIIWNKYYNEPVYINCWLNDDMDNDGVFDILACSNTIQVLSGATGNVIWEKDYTTLYPGECKDINGDGKTDVLAVNYMQIDPYNYISNMTALCGVNGNVIWENSFMHQVDIIPLEEVNNSTDYWVFTHGQSDQNGDGIPDPALNIEYYCGYLNEVTSEYDEYCSLKMIVINGANGEEMWDAQITSTWRNYFYLIGDYFDLDSDGLNDMILCTRSSIYAINTTGSDFVNQLPAAIFTSTPASPSTSDIITFNASSSCDCDGNIVSYDWYLGDGNNGSGVSIVHQYAMSGTYDVALTVTDNNGGSDWATATIIISDSITDNETLSIDSAVMDVGSTAVLPVAISNAVNISYLTFNITYDPEVVTITNITPSESIPSSTISYVINNGHAAVELTNSEKINVASSTAIMDITFQAGDNYSTTTLELQDIELTGDAGPHAPDMIINGNITVCIKGDFNNNNRVDIGDVARVAFMVAGKVDEDPRADFNDNGRVDVGDAAKISFFLAGKVPEL